MEGKMTMWSQFLIFYYFNIYILSIIDFNFLTIPVKIKRFKERVGI